MQKKTIQFATVTKNGVVQKIGKFSGHRAPPKNRMKK